MVNNSLTKLYVAGALRGLQPPLEGVARNKVRAGGRLPPL